MLLIQTKGVYDSDDHSFNHDALVVDSDKIIWIGNTSEVPERIRKQSYFLDLRHLWLFPGLINTHVHLEFDATQEARSHFFARDISESIELGLKQAQIALLSGTTTIRDAGSSWNLLNYQNYKYIDRYTLPKMQLCGPPLTITNGHLHFMHGVANTFDEMRQSILEHKQRGCTAIKIMATGGQMTPGSMPEKASYSKQDIRMMVDAAHDIGLPTLAHSLATEGFVNCIEGRVDCIEHCGCLVLDKGTSQLKRRYEPHIMNGYAGSNQFFMNGLATCYRSMDSIRNNNLSLSDSNRFKLEQEDMIFSIFHDLIKLGLTPVVGTDAGVMDTYFDETWLEIELMHERGGLSAASAIEAATTNAAKCMWLSDSRGALKIGYDADIIALYDNPLQNIRTFSKIPWVMRSGEVVKCELHIPVLESKS